jgi:preprotein translocase subunit SecG
MGVKQTTDVLEKGTWVFAAVIAVLCITSTFFIDGGDQVNDKLENVGSGPIPGNSQKTTTLPVAPMPNPDTNRR